jgi:ribonuclease HI
MQITLYTDGGSLNNPGPSAYGYAIYLDKKLLVSYSEPISIATNNVAEYTGLIKGLEKIKSLLLTPNPYRLTEIVVYSDSSLMVNQLNGLFKVKNAKIRELVLAIRIMENEINLPVKYIHIYREKNVFVDSLVKKALGR